MDPKEAWHAAGLYDPHDPGAAERLALLEFLTERGASFGYNNLVVDMRSLPTMRTTM